MCGIAGFADALTRDDAHAPERLDADARLVRRMCDVIRHRGPDDEGSTWSRASRSGMRRLSIIDLVDRPPADRQRGRRRAGSSSTARSTTSASCARELERARPPLRAPHRHRGDRPRVRGVGPTVSSRGCAGCSRSRSGTAGPRTLLLARDRAGHQAAVLRRARAAASSSAPS